MAGNAAVAGRSVTSKVGDILQSFTDGSEHSLTEIAKLTGLPTSTVYRLVIDLVSCGILERSESGHYTVGLWLKGVGGHAFHLSNLRERALPVIEDLAATTQKSVRLGLLDDLEVAYIEKPLGHRVVSYFSRSVRLPAHATALGKVLLAFSPPDILDAAIARGLRPCTPQTIIAPDRLRCSLSQIRLTCVAMARGEHTPGGTSIAVPVFGPGGRLVAALGLDSESLRTDLRQYQPTLTLAARTLARLLAAHESDGAESGNSSSARLRRQPTMLRPAERPAVGQA